MTLGFKKTIVEHDDGTGPYMTRWVLMMGRLGCLRLHHIHREDTGSLHHDHPFSFLSLVLRGWYLEELGGCRRPVLRRAGALGWRTAETPHRIEAVSPGGCWTLCWTTPHDPDRTWGFYTPDGWMDWRMWWRLNRVKAQVRS